MTEDINLLPLPKWMSNYTIPPDSSLFHEDVILADRMRDYARANVLHHTAVLQAEIERDEALLRQALEVLEVSTRFVYADLRPQCEDTIAALRERLAETANDLTRCPNCGGPADNGHDREVPPNPYWCSKCTES